MTSEELIEKIKNIRIWRRGDERAPHKPLVLLHTLGRISRGGPRLIPYEKVCEDLTCLLTEFLPYNRPSNPNYPFLRLSNDGIWEVRGKGMLDTKDDWSNTQLIANETAGGFTEESYNLLKRDEKLLYELARIILNQHFADTLHQEILDQVGLELKDGIARPRDPDFRDRILRAYEYRCAVCGFNVRLGNTLIAVEAAHIKWHCYGGPDLENNGIALCSMHHKLFDRGVFTLDNSFVLRVAEGAHGSTGFEEWLMRYHGRTIRRPQRVTYYPDKKFINWHIKEVFRGPSRYVVGR